MMRRQEGTERSRISKAKSITPSPSRHERLTMSNWLISLPFLRMRAVRCYIYLLVWIMMFSMGLYWILSLTELNIARDIVASSRNSQKKSENQIKSYKFIENKPHAVEPGVVQFINSESSQVDSDFGETEDSMLQSSIMRLCNARELIQVRDENFIHPAYTLDAVVLVFRHGDRGPLSHVGKRNVSHINCKGSLHSDFPALHQFASESMTKIPGYSQFIGPFHSFPKIPTSHVCHLGQLTQVGSSQLLHLGQLIRSTYLSTLPFINLNGGSGGRVIAYSTRYRRTLQSLLSFLYGLLGPKLLIPSVTIRESQSINFCFNDCSCRAADRLQKTAAKLYKAMEEEKTKKIHLVNKLNSILDLDKNKKTGLSLLDLLLVYPCHKTPLPCRSTTSENSRSQQQGPPNSTPECISNDALISLINLIKKETQGLQNILQQKQHSLLSSYGLLKEILGLSLKMTSGGSSSSNSGIGGDGSHQNQKNRLAIFSGHDTTLQSLIGALGIYSGHPDIHLPPFASRLIFEFYRKANVSPNSPRKHYFRVIYNGYSVTHLISFCKNIYNRRKDENGIGTKEFLCPLENLIRFLHDNYFESFGNSTTNFRDACR